MPNKTILREKLKESVSSVLPIALIVAVLCLGFVPVTTDLMLAFLLGTILLIVGMGLFTLGAEASMTQIGSLTGARITKSRRLSLILILSFVLGIAITVAEPDLTVLASNVPHINTTVLIITVSVGVGLFLVICMLRILFAVQLRWVLLGSYIVVFALAVFSDADFLSVAFDSGGVTTGPMTVPFIMALGVGVASIRSDKNAEADSFGPVALCSIGPILAVMILGFVYEMEDGTVASSVIHSYADTVEHGGGYLRAIPHYMGEVASALAPIVAFFLLFHKCLVREEGRRLDGTAGEDHGIGLYAGLKGGERGQFGEKRGIASVEDEGLSQRELLELTGGGQRAGDHAALHGVGPGAAELAEGL